MKKIAGLASFLLFFASFSAFAQEKSVGSEKIEEYKYGFFGLGVGLPYGWNGFNMEAHIYKRLFLSFGGGGIIDYQHNNNFIKPGFNIGPSIHLVPPDQVFQPAFMLLYGSNGLLISGNYNHLNYKVYRGLTFGLSNNFLFGRHNNNGISIDLMAILSSKLFKEVPDAGGDLGQRFKIGLAYKHRFRHQ